jgi:hypothetical protein
MNGGTRAGVGTGVGAVATGAGVEAAASSGIGVTTVIGAGASTGAVGMDGVEIGLGEALAGWEVALAAGRNLGGKGNWAGRAAGIAIELDACGGCGLGIGGAAWDSGEAIGATIGLLSSAAEASMDPIPVSSQWSDTSGKALIIFCTTSKLGLLRSLRIWLITGRPTPIRSANWVGVS